MVVVAIALWLVFAFVFWCMLAGATRGDLQIEAALERLQGDRGEQRSPMQDAAVDQSTLSHAT